MCRKLVDVALLSDAERKWLDAYHTRVWEELKDEWLASWWVVACGTWVCMGCSQTCPMIIWEVWETLRVGVALILMNQPVLTIICLSSRPGMIDGQTILLTLEHMTNGDSIINELITETVTYIVKNPHRDPVMSERILSSVGSRFVLTLIINVDYCWLLSLKISQLTEDHLLLATTNYHCPSFIIKHYQPSITMNNPPPLIQSFLSYQQPSQTIHQPIITHG